jgi:hypothetical protein
MTQLYFTETEGIGPSARVWNKINCPQGSGFFRTRGEGNPAFGFFDDFLSFSETTLTGGYVHLETNSATVAQYASTATAPGMVRLAADADGEEAVMQLGNALDVGPFRFQKDLAFEARVKVNAAAIVAGDHNIAVGLANGGASGAGTAGVLFSGDTLGATDFVGFQSLAAESTALDASYLVSGGTLMDGSEDTDLDTIHTLVAATWVKLGFRFYAAKPRKLEWFVDGVKVCQIGETEVNAAAFPDADADFMQPTIGLAPADSTAATLDIDWWACAQLY